MRDESNEGHIASPLPKRRLLWLSLLGFIVGSVAMLCFVLPAEFRIDLTGFGRWSGLSRLAGVEEVQVSAPQGATPIAHMTDTAFRTDTVDIPMGSGDTLDGNELEYKVRMKAGDTLVYAWDVTPAPPADEFYYDFHSQSDPTPQVRVLSHKQATGIKESGSLVAPFDGIHGWYLQNQSEKPVTVHLHLAGFYRLVTPEELAAAAAEPEAPPELPAK